RALLVSGLPGRLPLVRGPAQGGAPAVRRVVRWPRALEVGAFRPLAVRREQVHLGLGRRVRLLYASDLHLGHWWTRGVPGQLLAAGRQTRPDALLLGGDLAARRAALPLLSECVRALAGLAPVLAVPGNHDERAGLEGVRAAVVAAGGRWLPDAPAEQPLPIDGRLREPPPGPRLLCAHHPGVFPAPARAAYALSLA